MFLHIGNDRGYNMIAAEIKLCLCAQSMIDVQSRDQAISLHIVNGIGTEFVAIEISASR